MRVPRLSFKSGRVVAARGKVVIAYFDAGFNVVVETYNIRSLTYAGRGGLCRCWFQGRPQVSGP